MMSDRSIDRSLIMYSESSTGRNGHETAGMVSRAAALGCWASLGTPTIRPTAELAEELCLGEGRTNHNFIATLPSGVSLFVRIGEDLPSYGVSRRKEHAAARAAADAGLGPRVVHAEPDALVCELLRGRPLTAAQLREACGTPAPPDDLLRLVAAAVRALHACPPPEVLGGASGWVPADVRRWLGLAEERGFSRLPLVAEGRELLAAVEEAAGPVTGAPTFCHFDLLPDNFVRDGERLWLIDYEYAATGQPLVDLAILSMGCELTPSDDARLLAAYFEKEADDDLLRKFAALRLLACFRETLWGVVAEVSGTSALSMAEAVAYTDKNYAAFKAARDAFFSSPIIVCGL